MVPPDVWVEGGALHASHSPNDDNELAAARKRMFEAVLDASNAVPPPLAPLPLLLEHPTNPDLQQVAAGQTFVLNK